MTMSKEELMIAGRAVISELVEAELKLWRAVPKVALFSANHAALLADSAKRISDVRDAVSACLNTEEDNLE